MEQKTAMEALRGGGFGRPESGKITLPMSVLLAMSMILATMSITVPVRCVLLSGWIWILKRK